MGSTGIPQSTEQLMNPKIISYWVIVSFKIAQVIINYLIENWIFVDSSWIIHLIDAFIRVTFYKNHLRIGPDQHAIERVMLASLSLYIAFWKALIVHFPSFYELIDIELWPFGVALFGIVIIIVIVCRSFEPDIDTL